MAKTGSWFHGKDTQSAYPVRQLELSLSTPPSTPSTKDSLQNVALGKPSKSSLSPNRLRKTLSNEEEETKRSPNGSNSNLKKTISSPLAKAVDSENTIGTSRLSDESSRKSSNQDSDSSESSFKKKSVTFGDENVKPQQQPNAENVTNQNSRNQKEMNGMSGFSPGNGGMDSEVGAEMVSMSSLFIFAVYLSVSHKRQRLNVLFRAIFSRDEVNAVKTSKPFEKYFLDLRNLFLNQENIRKFS